MSKRDRETCPGGRRQDAGQARIGRRGLLMGSAAALGGAAVLTGEKQPPKHDTQQQPRIRWIGHN